MINNILTKLVFLLAAVFLTAACFGENPVIQTKFTSDPAPMVYKDTVFLYTGHDEDDADGFKMLDWLLYTSTDMVNWRDRGAVATLKDFAWAGTNGAWAAQCIYRNGKFYLYCPVQLRGIGVLVSDSPYGPFTDPLGKQLINNSSDDIDPSVFIDEDGQAYLYWGNPNVYYVKLNKDMISYSGSIVKLPKIQTYQEAPWIYKCNDRYYLAFASTCCPEGIGYAMSDSPMGPWTYKGSIMDGNPNSSGNHPGIIDFKGKTYVFGFNYAINFSQTTVHRERRSVCAEVMKYSADGAIPKLSWWGGAIPSPSGISQVGNLNPFDTTQAEVICWEKGVRTEACKDNGGGMYVDSIHSGDYIKVKGADFGTGAASFDARVASAAGGGSIEIHLDSLSGTAAGTCSVKGTGGWQTWTTNSCAVSGAAGVHDLFLKFTGSGFGMLFNFNWWKFNPVTVGTARKDRTGYEFGFKAAINNASLLSMRFPRAVLWENISVCLFDIAGRKVKTLFTGQISSADLVLPLNRAQIHSGIYELRVSLKNRKTLTEKIVLQ